MRRDWHPQLSWIWLAIALVGYSALISPSTLAQTGQPSPLQGASSPLTGTVSNLQGLVDELGGRITDSQIAVELPADVLFDFDRADIRPAAVPTLEKLAAIIQGSGSGAVQIAGHTDSVGEDAYNMVLSERRAAAVANWLTSQRNVLSDRLTTQGLGETQPVAANTLPDGSDNPQGRQKNRRVVVVVQRD
jgi:outer membrane protein OmpA-like peptidoglycan-associated protein